MKEKYRIKKSNEFDTIIKKGKKSKNLYFLLFFQENNYDYSRFGIAISKKNGNAVKRNLYKRRIREILNKNRNMFKKGTDYIIIVNRSCEKLNFQELEKHLLQLL